MPGELHELSRAIGSLEANVKNLTQELKDEREDAARHRRDLRQVIESLSASVRTLAQQVHDIRAVSRYRKWVWGVLLAIGGAVTSSIFEVAKIMVAWFKPTQ